MNCPPAAFPPPGSIAIANPADDIACTNVFDRSANGGSVIGLLTSGGDEDIDLNNSGELVSTSAGGVLGILTVTYGDTSSIDIVNSGDITAGSGIIAFGIRALTEGGRSPISIVNSGDIAATGDTYRAYGIHAHTQGDGSAIEIRNSGDIAASTSANFNAFGIKAETDGADSPLNIVNRGDMAVTATGDDAYAFGIDADTDGADSPLSVVNRGDISVTTAGDNARAYGLSAATDAAGSPLGMVNIGDISVVSGADSAHGISGITSGEDSPLSIENSGDIEAIGADSGQGISATTFGDNSPLEIKNSGDIEASGAIVGTGIRAFGAGDNGSVSIENSGDIAGSAEGFARGIDVTTSFAVNTPVSIVNSGDLALIGDGPTGIRASTDEESPIDIVNSGDIAAFGGIVARGIEAETEGANSSITIRNRGDIALATAGGNNFSDAYGISATAYDSSPIDIDNRGDMALSTVGPYADAYGIFAKAYGDVSSIEIVNRGRLRLRAAHSGYGIDATAYGSTSPLSILNSGDMEVETSTGSGTAIRAFTYGPSSPLEIENKAKLTVTSAATAFGMNAYTANYNSPITVLNNGDITASGAVSSYGIAAVTEGGLSPIDIVNTAKITTGVYGIYAATSGAASPIAIFNSGVIDPEVGISAVTLAPDSPITIENTGSAYGDLIGISTYSVADTTIINSGEISAASKLAIAADGPGDATIFNSGVIKGYIVLDADDTFINQNGGVFEAKLTSDFGPGEDLFRNEEGGRLQAATDRNAKETTSLVNLERFENQGTISLQDGSTGDVFSISNTPGKSDLDFIASGRSQLEIDVFLGGAQSRTDSFVIDGTISGETKLNVNNANRGPGVFNPQGIPVLTMAGSVSPDAFLLSQPIDTGFFDYDLFYKLGATDVFELRSFPGAGAHLLPQLVTAAHDIWHSTAETWFDRSTDLRVLLNGGGTDLDLKSGDMPRYGTSSFTPGAWIRGSGNWREQEDNASTSAFARTYRYNLERDLDIWNVELGLDFGKRALLSPDDALVLGVLGGFTQAELDYGKIARGFDFEGGEVGGYATYLRGGLFVDTLVKVDFLELDTNTLGFPGSLDSTNVGVRVDSGYRFGGYRSGVFLEPLATLAVVWSDINSFAKGGNQVSFDDDANLRGRLGLRLGSTYSVWNSSTLEPFVIGSVWGNLSDDENQARLTSTSTSFVFIDDLTDVWGEISGGVNLFSPDGRTSAFAKIDVSFGDDLTGIGGKLGVRTKW